MQSNVPTQPEGRTIFKWATVLVITVVFSTSISAQENKSPNPASWPTSNIPAEEAHFTPEQLKDYYLVYTNADVRYLRKRFDSYLHSEPGNEEEFKLLKKWNSDYYRTKFVVFSRDRNPFGGALVKIMFQGKPDKIFVAWVYPEGKAGKLTLRAFEADKFNDEDIARIRMRYKKILADKEHAM